MRNTVANIKSGYILSIIHRDDKNACHINIIYIFTFNQFHDKCPFLLGTVEKSTVFNGIMKVYKIPTNTIYANNKYGISSGREFICVILNIGCKNITKNAICDNNLFENVLDQIKYSINCMIIKE
jgi:hypothetical protein